MKKLRIIIIAILITSLTSCDLLPDDEGGSDTESFDGSISSVRDFFNPGVVNALQSIGFNIHEGDNPPLIIDGTYTAHPFILQNSTVPGDHTGSTFQDYIIAFSNQNNQALTIDFISQNGGQSSDGSGSYISGYGNYFSIFLKANTSYQGETAKFAYAISGKVVEGGIADFQFANIMLDDNGDPGGFWIENNTGRLLHDSDHFSPREGASSSEEEQTGSVKFWINQDFGCGNITVNLNGNGSSVITGYFGSAPDCSNTSGGGNFSDLSPGNYSFSASCSGKTWSGTATIQENGCLQYLLN